MRQIQRGSLCRLFIESVTHFFVVALALYTLAQVYSRASHESIITKTAKCKYCRKAISVKAQRCGSLFLCQLSPLLSDGFPQHFAPAGRTAVKMLPMVVVDQQKRAPRSSSRENVTITVASMSLLPLSLSRCFCCIGLGPGATGSDSIFLTTHALLLPLRHFRH